MQEVGSPGSMHSSGSLFPSQVVFEVSPTEAAMTLPAVCATGIRALPRAEAGGVASKHPQLQCCEACTWSASFIVVRSSVLLQIMAEAWAQAVVCLAAEACP
jgi:hypothetical protein